MKKLLIVLPVIALLSWQVFAENVTMNSNSAIIRLDESTSIGRVQQRDLTATIGDPTASNFVPNFKLSAWGGECVFSVDLKIDARANKASSTAQINESGVMQFQVRQESVLNNLFYIRSDGNLEWELVLDSKPHNNVFDFNFTSFGLKFVYQDTALIRKEIREKTANFPDSTVYSWIAYHNSKKHNRIHISIDGDTTVYNYGTGIAFRIFRPRAIDSRGDSVWCSLNIDTVINKLSVTVPETFLNKAVYPVSVDPTIGNSTGGLWFANPSNWALFALYWTYDSPSEDGSITKGYIQSYRNNNSFACSLRTFVYDYSLTLAQCDLIASSDSIAVTNGLSDGDAQWNEMLFNNESVYSINDYFPAFKGYSESNNALRVGYGIGSWGDLKYTTGSDWSPPATLAGANDDNEAWSCYFEYVTSEGDGFAYRRRRLILGGN